MKRPLILVSNDDGVQAKGLNELIGMLRPLGDVIVMAPRCSPFRVGLFSYSFPAGKISIST